ncbi:MAG: DUF4142 domain-containing protein [Sphingomonas sp.]|uniref:DUF4142 domain-containing protein n=1 Tax=Sphingomonas sp. TaxID=28214 RepID=UPI001203A696|nr:DUF4142 domain-containing protein [Sphingomonas sp.]THD38360.1 MAG: DUF4142 domain-containing protein [Sphingomonas sp.]
MIATALRYLTPLALVTSLAACGHKDATTTDTNATTTTTTDDSGMANAGMADTNMANATAMAPATPAQAFADKAAKSDAFEIAAAKLAETNAASAGVKDFARKMIKAHSDSTAKIKLAASSAAPAITPDATLTDDQKGKLDDLGKLKGADFDKAYMTGQVAAHEEALAAMKDYAATGDAPSLKKAAGEIAPVVEQHLTMARALASK